MKRYEEIDSLRGIAALTVIISHGLAIFALPSNLLDITPLYFLWSSHEAVIFFFVLSGFVLTLPFLKRNIMYSSYIIKRVIRIYIPYLVAIIFSFLLFFLFSRFGGLKNLGEWVVTKWHEDPSLSVLLQHIFLLGNFDTSQYNPAIWTLVQEMRISFIFPFIVYLVIKLKTRYVLLIGILLSLIACSNIIFGFQESLGHHTSLFDTLHYTFMFIIGSVLAKNKDVLITIFQNYKKHIKWIILILALGFYLYSRVVYIIPLLLGMENLTQVMIYIQDWGISIGAGSFIIISIASTKMSYYLSGKIVNMNGKLSYSTYLYHAPIFFAMFSVFSETLNHWLIFIFSIVIIYFVSYLSWKYVENPCIKLGRKLTKKNHVPSTQ